MISGRAADAERLPADRQRAGREAPGARDQIEEAVVHDAQPAAVGEVVAEAVEPGVPAGFRIEDVLQHAGALAPLFRAAEDRPGETRPLAHHAEGVADGEQRGALVGEDAVEEMEERRLPGGILADALALRRDAVVLVRVDVPRTAGADVEREAAAGGLGDHAAAAHVEGERADADPGLLGDRQELAGVVEQGMDEAVVAEVRPAVVHVEHGDVDDARIGRREVLGALDADAVEVAAVRLG